jgi:hypothetical protein
MQICGFKSDGLTGSFLARPRPICWYPASQPSLIAFQLLPADWPKSLVRRTDSCMLCGRLRDLGGCCEWLQPYNRFVLRRKKIARCAKRVSSFHPTGIRTNSKFRIKRGLLVGVFRPDMSFLRDAESGSRQILKHSHPVGVESPKASPFCTNLMAD